jgi:protein SCO1/2
MKTKTILIALFALTLLAALSVFMLVCGSQSLSGTQTFQVFGEICAISLTNKTIRISHEEIPNYMPAMTMPFAVKDSRLLNGLAEGDHVKFELMVTRNDSWLARIEKIAAAGTNENTASLPALSLEDREAECIQSGQMVPEFDLVDQNGKPFHLSDFRGKAVVLTFIYTRCPIPNYCPLMSKNFSELRRRFDKEFTDKYQLLSITMDPGFDRPEVLKEYGSHYGSNGEEWKFATGNTQQINFVAGLLGLYYTPENGTISHDLRTALIGADGRLVHLWKSNVWTPYEVQRMVRKSLTGADDIASINSSRSLGSHHKNIESQSPR